MIAELKRVQKVLNYRFSQKLHNREAELRIDLEEVLSHEELLWFQKSRAEWLRYRDRNTSSFYNRALIRRKRNRIEGFLISDDWCFEEEVLRRYVNDFFSKLYTIDYQINGFLKCSHSFSLVPANDMECYYG